MLTEIELSRYLELYLIYVDPFFTMFSGPNDKKLLMTPKTYSQYATRYLK